MQVLTGTGARHPVIGAATAVQAGLARALQAIGPGPLLAALALLSAVAGVSSVLRSRAGGKDGQYR